jgi:hypothetical protein
VIKVNNLVESTVKSAKCFEDFGNNWDYNLKVDCRFVPENWNSNFSEYQMWTKVIDKKIKWKE